MTGAASCRCSGEPFNDWTGLPSVWAPAAKNFIGTSAGTPSRVYFTGAEGVLTEVFYPTLDRVQNVDLQFLVTDAAKTWGDEERR